MADNKNDDVINDILKQLDDAKKAAEAESEMNIGEADLKYREESSPMQQMSLNKKLL